MLRDRKRSSLSGASIDVGQISKNRIKCTQSLTDLFVSSYFVQIAVAYRNLVSDLLHVVHRFMSDNEIKCALNYSETHRNK